ncbi:MAG TPA: GMP/IMP nucleotidase [Chromatiales bacterium]|nr:GMP/IMP nucleotidase [Chromatiaceae bacterium]HIB85302.1 GMP/IMP nucleotidase [Chromatiaceae bacterium]HIN83254.1 GMP/IMP nucleotidase [Chromatiales bacterium]HIO14581.1 GMP/IMP nucleotidase [Chromatiales bacterium]HIO55371.1 GMP/IMP nucleotidase [Chromatiales bacterium]
MLKWSEIESVYLDMDGTLLDLHFDNYFWQEYVPMRFGECHDMDVAAAKAELYPRFRRVEGTMDWYCVDYWSRELGLDIEALKHEIQHLIGVHPQVETFLTEVRASGRELVLVTNAHQKSLSLKMRRTGLQRYFDGVVCSHRYAAPKEDQRFWVALQRQRPFDATRTLLVDDSIAVLQAARAYGIGHLLAISEPDSKALPREISGFPAIRNFSQLLPVPK